MKRSLLGLALILSVLNIHAQSSKQVEDSLTIRKIYDYNLLQGKSYKWLDHLSNEIGGRLSGSLNAQKAVEYTKETIGFFRAG